MKKINSILPLVFVFVLSACNYSNEFTGSFNGTPATLSAYSKNVNRYCIALNLKGAVTKSNFISASDVYNSSDIFAAKSFNTEGTQCAANQSEYLVGNRVATVLSTSEVSRVVDVGFYDCQTVYYNAYSYRETINVEFRNKISHATTGSFNGTGLVNTYVDTDRPTRYGRIWMCRNPYPGPFPGPGYPRPFPRPRPGPRPF